MSRSSARRGQRSSARRSQRSSARRGQTEPLAALAAVVVVGLALSLYAGVLGSTAPSPGPSGVADATLDRVHGAVSDGAVATPGRLDAAPDAAPEGYALNATLTAGGETWQVGPVPPADAPNASRATSVRLGPGIVRPGRLEVVVWS